MPPFIRISGLLTAGLLLVGAAQAADMTVPVPQGFRMMCLDHPAECRGGGASSVAYTPRLSALLDEVNRTVNAAIKPVRNEMIDVWSINAKQGDCEEYVIAKRRALIRAGVPASALSFVYALRSGGGHAILAINTDAGSFVLDNMSSRIKPLRRTGYRLVSMSGPDPKVWHRV